MVTVQVNGSIKRVRSENYNYNFDTRNGFFMRWGATPEVDPGMAPMPEIADIEIASGACSGRCAWCYKGNGRGRIKYMDLGTFKVVLANLTQGSLLTQVALGITDLNANPDLVPILEYCRAQGIVPNLTTNGLGLDRDWAYRLARLCGAIAVSCYPHTEEQCFDAIGLLYAAGLQQVNMHLMVHRGNFEWAKSIMWEASGIAGLNAVVLLSLKQVGNATSGFEPLTDAQFSELADLALQGGRNFGFDSCTATKFTKYLEGKDELAHLLMMVEPCESGLFSIYVDVDGKVWPCSFTEEAAGIEPIDLLTVDDFQREVWDSLMLRNWRAELWGHGRACPRFEV